MTDEERKVWDEMVEFAKRPPSPVYSHLTIYNNRTILAADAELTRLREEWDALYALKEHLRAQLAEKEAQLCRAREALEERIEVMELSDGDGERSKSIVAPEDRTIRALCEELGYGAVMDSAARQWFKKDKDGAHTSGACAATVRRVITSAKAALSSTVTCHHEARATEAEKERDRLKEELKEVTEKWHQAINSRR